MSRGPARYMSAFKRFLREEEEQMGLVKDYRGIYIYCRLLSSVNKKGRI
jgi:hypothetical protein